MCCVRGAGQTRAAPPPQGTAQTEIVSELTSQKGVPGRRSQDHALPPRRKQSLGRRLLAPLIPQWLEGLLDAASQCRALRVQASGARCPHGPAGLAQSHARGKCHPYVGWALSVLLLIDLRASVPEDLSCLMVCGHRPWPRLLPCPLPPPPTSPSAPPSPRAYSRPGRPLTRKSRAEGGGCGGSAGHGRLGDSGTAP